MAGIESQPGQGVNCDGIKWTACSNHAISAALAAQGHLNECGQPYNPKSIRTMLAGVTFVLLVFIIPMVALAYSAYLFLRHGIWVWVTLGWFTDFRLESDWVGLAALVNYGIQEAWIGFISAGVGFLAGAL